MVAIGSDLLMDQLQNLVKNHLHFQIYKHKAQVKHTEAPF